MPIPRTFLMLGVIATLVACETARVTGVTSARDGAAAREAPRIQRHLRGAEMLLLARDVSGLPAAARASRARLIGALRTYCERGQFPRNHDFVGRRVPYFVDVHGTPCAVAYLMLSTGDADLVAHIASLWNNARIHELAGVPELVAWLGRNGLSIDEAARIQPAYGYERSHERDDGAAIVTGTTLGLEATSIILNMDRARTGRGRAWRCGLGIFAGFGGTIAGMAILETATEQSPSWGGACIALGLVSVVMGGHQLAERRSAATFASVSPMLRQRSGQPFVGLCARF
jgi:hypothetical protein